MDAEREREKYSAVSWRGLVSEKTDNTCTAPCMQLTLGGEADYVVTHLQCVNAPPITSDSIEPQV